jgi:hypothetical protein
MLRGNLSRHCEHEVRSVKQSHKGTSTPNQPITSVIPPFVMTSNLKRLTPRKLLAVTVI